MMKPIRFSILGLLVLALPLSASHAAQPGGFVGIGVGMSPDYEGSEDYEAVPTLFGKYKWGSGRYVALGGTAEAARAGSLKFNLIAGSNWELGPMLQYRWKREDVDNSAVDKMKDIDAATEAGAFIGYKSGPWFTNLGLAYDVSDTYEGFIADLQGGYRQEVSSDFTLKYSVSISYADDDYMETYFGVKSADSVRSGLPVYSADGGIKDYGLGISADYKFNQSWGMLGSVNYYRLAGDAEDSPVVNNEGDENQFSAALALTYSF